MTAGIPGAGESPVQWSIRNTAEISGTEAPDSWCDEITNLTVTWNEEVYVVYPAYQAYKDTVFVYTMEELSDGTGFEIRLGTKCACTPDICTHPEGGCTGLGNGFCTCWDLAEDTVVQFNYACEGQELIENRNSADALYRSRAELLTSGHESADEEVMVYAVRSTGTYTAVSAEADVEIPGAIAKQHAGEPAADNGYTTSYSVTVNEDRQDLSSLLQLDITDQMSDTLTYVSGSMTVTAADAENSRVLAPEEYTLKYDEEAHLLTLEIPGPGAYAYTLTYDAKIQAPDGADTAEYTNTASVVLFGNEVYTASDKERTLTDILPTETEYSVTITSTEGDSGENNPLSGTVFGLFAANGEEIANGETDENGTLTLTHSTLRAHELYYVQEIEPAEMYRTNPEKYWFCFCSADEESCESCASLMTDTDGADRVLPGEDCTIEAVSYYIGRYRLPATGGPGIFLHVLVGSVFTAVPLVYGCIVRRKRERRGES